MTIETDPNERVLQTGIDLPDDRVYYFNSFACAISATDVLIVLQRNGKSITTLNCSYSMAKTLANGLVGLIGDLEKKIGRQIEPVDQIQKFLSQ